MNAKCKNKLIEVSDLHFHYGENLALEDISFCIEEGDFLAIVGPNGSGKTTLIKLLLGLHSPSGGSIKVLGKTIQHFSKFGKIGYVPQKATHFDTNFPATVREVVEMGLLANKKFPKLMTDKDSIQVKRMLMKVGMEEYEEQRIGYLSGGQQQRVLIAKAIISRPKILFLDEPVAGIDAKSQNNFFEMLKDLNKGGITIVLISHDIGRVTKYVTKVASLHRQLRFYGSHKEFCIWDKEHKHHTPHTHKLCPEL